MKSTISKNKEGYGYKYTELAEINKYCEENGIRYYQEIETNELNLKDYIITYLITEEGEVTKHRGCQIVDAVLQGIKNPVQEYGSSLTYCRRYSLLMALGLATEDDDAQSLTVKKEWTLEEAKAYKITFGKYSGKALEEINEKDSKYMDWLLYNSKDENLKNAVSKVTGKPIYTEEEWKELEHLQITMDKLIIELEDKDDTFHREVIYDKYGHTQDYTKEIYTEIIETLKKKLEA